LTPASDLGEGLGLGLAIVDRLAKTLGARVEVASHVGRGSRFSLSLPLDATVDEVASVEHANKDSGGRIMIVEDNVLVLFWPRSHVAGMGLRDVHRRFRRRHT
jgi:chemotaxis protein histidine kinase CheA